MYHNTSFAPHSLSGLPLLIVMVVWKQSVYAEERDVIIMPKSAEAPLSMLPRRWPLRCSPRISADGFLSVPAKFKIILRFLSAAIP